VSEILSATSRHATQVRRKVFMTGLLGALAGLLFGLDIGVISGALPFIAREFDVPDQVQEWIVSSMMFGAAFGALAAGWLSYRLGRKYSLLLGALLFVVGSLLCALAWGPVPLILARVLLGLAVGIASFTAPLYLSEIAPGKVRGSMISLYQLMITLGILLAFLSNTFFSYSGAWRWMLGIIAIPAVILFFGVLLLPRSPRWLMLRGREAHARRVLQQLRVNDTEVEHELDEIRQQLAQKQQGWGLFFANRHVRRAVYLGMLLQIMQQLTGMNVVMYYAPRIFDLAGFNDPVAQMWGTVIVGLTNVLATFIAIALVDRWGRKPVLYVGFLTMGLGIGVLGLLMHIGIDSQAQQMAAVAMLLIFITGFAMSAGPLVWVLCSEIQPLRGRDFGIAVSTFTNWIANMVVGATFLTMLNVLGSAHTFWFYAGCNLLFILLTLLLVPETRGVSLERIERNLFSGKALRSLGD
jgi:SP family galactose:H+ symporter-like MFS transporter